MRGLGYLLILIQSTSEKNYGNFSKEILIESPLPGQLIISAANKPKSLTSPHALPLIANIIAISTWPKQCNAQSATLHRPPKKKKKRKNKISKTGSQINKRTRRVMRAKISLFKELLGLAASSEDNRSPVPGSSTYLSFAGSPRGQRYGPGGNNHEQIL